MFIEIYWDKTFKLFNLACGIDLICPCKGLDSRLHCLDFMFYIPNSRLQKWPTFLILERLRIPLAAIQRLRNEFSTSTESIGMNWGIWFGGDWKRDGIVWVTDYRYQAFPWILFQKEVFATQIPVCTVVLALMKHMATDVAAELGIVELIAKVSTDVLASAGSVVAGSWRKSSLMGNVFTYGNSVYRRVELTSRAFK